MLRRPSPPVRHGVPVLLAAALLSALLVLVLAARPAGAAPPTMLATPIGEPARAGGVLRFPQAVAIDPRNGEVVVGDQYSGTIQVFSPTGEPRRSFGGLSLRGELGRFDVVGGVAMDRNGRLFVLDSTNDRIQVLAVDDGRLLTTIGADAGMKLLTGGRPDRGIVAGGIAVHQEAPGRSVVVFVADSANHRVVRWTLDPVSLRPYGPPATTSRAAGVNLQYPQGLAVDPSGSRLYVADNQHHRILRLSARSLKVQARAGTYGRGPGEINAPYDVAVDTRNRLYIADNLNGRLNIHDATTLEYVGTAGGRGRTVGRFAIVRAVATSPTDPAGGAVVADTSNNRIQRVRPDGTVWAAWGIAGRGPGYFTRPKGVAVAADGTIAVADTFVHRVALTAADGTYVGQRAWVSPSTDFPHWGKEHPQQMLLPGDVAFDTAGALWTADTYNDRVQRMAPDGTVVLVSRRGLLKRPRSIAAAPDGTVWIADTSNARVVRMLPDGNVQELRGNLGSPYAVTVGPSGRGLVATATTIRDVVTNERIPPPPGASAWARPVGLALAADGTLYVAEERPKVPGGARLLRGTPDGRGGRTWDVLAAETSHSVPIVEPGNIALTPDGETLLVADAGQDRVLRFDVQGKRPPVLQQVSVALEGGGASRGTVTSDPPGIDCGTDCGQGIAPTRAVTLTARPHAGSTFMGWGGACAAATVGPTCTLDLSQARHATARFEATPPPAVRIRGLRVTPARWHLTRRKGPRSRRPMTRARLEVTLNAEARVRLEVLQARPGRRAGKRCVALRRGARTRKPCTRFAVLPQRRTLKLIEGRTTVDVGPRVRGRTLAPGRYRLRLTATNAGGEHVRTTRSIRITR
jgi:DNA-binding beta-propeller fold protein YncE